MTRRADAAALATVDAAAPARTGARSYVHGSGAVTREQRRDLRDAMKAGRTARMRQAAAEHVDRVQSIAAATGREITATDWLLSSDWTDVEGERIDARAVLADAEQAAAHTGRNRGRYSDRNAARMTHRDAASLAAYAARCMARMSRPAMSDDEQQDAELDALAALLERGHGTFPRWDALTPSADAEQAGYDQTAERSRWRGWAYLTARAMSRTRHERLTAEQAADFSDPGEDAPTAEQAAAHAAELAASLAAYALESVEGSTLDALAATAPGKGLTAAERDALTIGLSGLTRAELAAARGVDADTVKKGAQRGRRALAARVPDAAAARQWARAAARKDRDGWDAALAATHVVPDAMRADAAPYRGVRLIWPPRIGEVGEEGDFLLPAAPVGAGSSARTAYAAADRISRDPRGCILRPGASLDRVRLRARTLRALAGTPRPEQAAAPVGATYAERTRPAPVSYGQTGSKERDRMRVDAERSAAAAARDIFPAYRR